MKPYRRPAISADDAKRLDLLSGMPCICCEYMKIAQPFRTEIHHIISHGYRKHSGGDQSTIPLDGWHHRGICLDGFTTTDMTAKYGPSLATNKRLFVKVFGDEQSLLELTNKLLAELGVIKT